MQHRTNYITVNKNVKKRIATEVEMYPYIYYSIQHIFDGLYDV